MNPRGPRGTALRASARSAAFALLGRSPLLFVGLFYIGAALGLACQELSLLMPGAARAVFHRLSFPLLTGLVVVGPAWGVLRALWLLAHRRRVDESFFALLLSLPLLFVLVGSAQRAAAQRVSQGKPVTAASGRAAPEERGPMLRALPETPYRRRLTRSNLRYGAASLEAGHRPG